MRGAKPLFMRAEADKRFETWYERLTLVRGVITVVGAALGLVLVAGILVRIVEPEVFSSIGLSYWWAIVTVTTVGYGDVVPESPAGRLVGVLLMLTGLGLIPTLTSVVVSTLIGKRTREQQVQLDRLRLEYAASLERIEAHLGRLGEGAPGGS